MTTVICFGGFVIMLVIFLLYLMMLTLHWKWGWSALALAAALLVISIGVGVIFRIYIHSSNPEKVKIRGNGPLGKLWKGVWNIAKPLIAAYLAKKVAEKAKMPDSKWL